MRYTSSELAKTAKNPVSWILIRQSDYILAKLSLIVDRTFSTSMKCDRPF
ncbi:hypothetical protein [Microcoleus sp. CAWBG51]|nr:hypothetical protein [Microcoleus sp. CAWBG51]